MGVRRSNRMLAGVINSIIEMCNSRPLALDDGKRRDQ